MAKSGEVHLADSKQVALVASQPQVPDPTVPITITARMYENVHASWDDPVIQKPSYAIYTYIYANIQYIYIYIYIFVLFYFCLRLQTTTILLNIQDGILESGTAHHQPMVGA